MCIHNVDSQCPPFSTENDSPSWEEMTNLNTKYLPDLQHYLCWNASTLTVLHDACYCNHRCTLTSDSCILCTFPNIDTAVFVWQRKCLSYVSRRVFVDFVTAATPNIITSVTTALCRTILYSSFAKLYRGLVGCRCISYSFSYSLESGKLKSKLKKVTILFVFLY